MSDEEVHVDLDAVRHHEDTVRFLAEELDAAARAISQVTAPSFAYGILCSPILMGPMALVQNDGIAGVNAVREVMGAVADNLETTVTTYEATDTATATGMTRLQSDL